MTVSEQSNQKYLFRVTAEELYLDEDIKREVEGKRLVLDKTTGKMKQVDIYDRNEAPKKKVADDKVRAMLSSNVEQSIIPADFSKERILS
jgi:hypothetical protein